MGFGLIGCGGLGLFASRCKIEEFWLLGVLGWLIRLRSSGWLKYLGFANVSWVVNLEFGDFGVWFGEIWVLI